MKQLQIRSKLNQATRTRGIHMVKSFTSSYIQQYETQGATSELLQSLNLFLNVQF